MSGPLVVWAGWRGCFCGKGGWSCLVGWFSRVWLACPCWYRRHTLCCLCLVVVGAPLRAWCVWGGGRLAGFWGSAPWLPDPSGAPGCWGLWVGVGGLVVNCIVDASILL